MLFAIFVVVSVVSRIRFGRSGVRIEASSRDFSILQNVHTSSGGPTEPPLAWVPRFFHGGKVVGTCSPPLKGIDCRVSVRRELYLHSFHDVNSGAYFYLFLVTLTPLITAIKAL